MNGNSPLSLAQRTCSQCKASKKKCDKLLPKCNRCLRLSIHCTYSEPERQNGSEEVGDSRFDEVFRRLEKIESHVFATNALREEYPPQERLAAMRAKQPVLTDSNSESWPFNSDTLKPNNMRLSLYSSVLRALKEHDKTTEVIAHAYFEHTHKWLPMIAQVKFDKQHALFKTMESDNNFLLQISAMHLLVTPYAEHPPAASLEASSWYMACKSFFAHYVALGEPSIGLIQAGILIALFEYLQCVGDRASTTLGICARLGYMLELDEVFAMQSNYDPGEMSIEHEEVVLTYWGLGMLDRYFNMPPLAIPKQPSMHYQPLKDTLNNSGCAFRGPPTTGFKTIDSDILDYTLMEVEASHRLRRVHTFIRHNRHQTAASISDGVRLLLREFQESLMMLKIRSKQNGSRDGIVVSLSAGLQLQCFFVEKQGYLDQDTMQSLHSYIEQIRDIVGQSRVFNGFTENYMEGIQPTRSSILYQAMHAYKMVCSADKQRTLPEIDLSVCLEAMQMMAQRYKHAEKCLQLLELS